jgi:hypothetical protein
VAVGDGGGIGINPHSPQRLVMLAPLPSRRRGREKGLDNLSVSSRPRVPSYAIGRDRGEE